LVVIPTHTEATDIPEAVLLHLKQNHRYPCTMASVRIKFRLSSVLLVLLLLGTVEIHAQAAAPAKPQPPATILLIRHAEKLTDGRIDLSPTGFERARLLPKLFSPTAARPDLPAPQVLFATHLSEHSNRPVQTVTPLAAALHLPINDSFSNDDYPALAAALLSGKYAGKVVLVVWHHGKIPQLASALGATPPYTPWPDTQFDRIWRIDYANGKATLQDLPYAIMPGDSK
jgi:broad specificity phosphatase PhoE